MANLPIMLSLREAATRTGLSYWFLREAFLGGILPGIRVGRKIFLNADDLSEFLGGSKDDDS